MMAEQPKSEVKPQTLMYERIQIKICYPIPIRKGTCMACGKSVQKREIKTTQLHHTVYKYEIATVRKNPVLALDYTLEFGFCCHPIADGFRDLLLANPRGALRPVDKIINVGMLLPKEQQDQFTSLCKKWLKMRNGK
jgi:hypothetical protein